MKIKKWFIEIIFRNGKDTNTYHRIQMGSEYTRNDICVLCNA